MRVVSLAVLALAGFVAWTLGAVNPSAQVPSVVREFGAPVAPMFEGWYGNPDGTASILVGFFNPNQRQTVDLPVGALNSFSPGPEDLGQPTHFPPGRSWGVLTIQVPGDFNGDLTWTLTANEQPASIPVHLEAPYFIEPLRNAADGNEPPTIRFAQDGQESVGPPVGIAHALTATVGRPLDLIVWTSDVKPPKRAQHTTSVRRRASRAVTLRWHLHRGPALVTFGEAVQGFDDSADQNPRTTATFSTSGEYLLRAEVLDETGVAAADFSAAGHRPSCR